MPDTPELDPAFVAELEKLITKLASPTPSFTAREAQLMQTLRIHREEVVAQMRAALSMSAALNPAGRRKLERVAAAIEEICQVD